MKPGFIKISKVAEELGVSRQTLWRWKWNGDLNFHKFANCPMNFISIEDFNKLKGIQENKEEKIVIYARVSSSVNKTNLETQVERLKAYSIAKGYKIHKIVKEFGSGLNDSRKGLCKLLENQDFTKIVVEHKDRLTRSGFNYIKTCLEKNGKQIEVVNEAEDDESSIIQDFVAIITSYCARIYGKRRSQRKTEKLIRELKED